MLLGGMYAEHTRWNVCVSAESKEGGAQFSFTRGEKGDTLIGQAAVLPCWCQIEKYV